MRIRSAGLAGACAVLVVGGFTGVAAAAPSGGANTDGPYTSANPGVPETSPDSMNGQGNAPHAAGSKGKADDKNPPGQLKRAASDDPEAGYECDSNSGVAQGNPAHSGCGGEVPR